MKTRLLALSLFGFLLIGANFSVEGSVVVYPESHHFQIGFPGGDVAVATLSQATGHRSLEVPGSNRSRFSFGVLDDTTRVENGSGFGYGSCVSGPESPNFSGAAPDSFPPQLAMLCLAFLIILGWFLARDQEMRNQNLFG